MSRQYDARQHALAVYPEDREAGVYLFMDFLNIDHDDFAYEEGMSAEEYIYGDVRSPIELSNTRQSDISRKTV